MNITFLGTGTSQGIPVITCHCPVCRSNDMKDKRLRSSVLIEIDGVNLVIDAGPDFRQQMIRAQLDHLDAMLVTHGHKDHIGGLDDVRAYNYVSGQPIPVYANETTCKDIRRDFHYVFSGNAYPGIPRINLIPIDTTPFSVRGIKIIPIEVLHMNLKIIGFRIGDLTYITDANDIPLEGRRKIRGSKILIINALRIKKHVSHFNLEEALEMIRSLAPGKAFLTHLSHRMGKHEEVSSLLPEGVFLGYDGLVIDTDEL